MILHVKNQENPTHRGSGNLKPPGPMGQNPNKTSANRISPHDKKSSTTTWLVFGECKAGSIQETHQRDHHVNSQKEKACDPSDRCGESS